MKAQKALDKQYEAERRLKNKRIREEQRLTKKAIDKANKAQKEQAKHTLKASQ